MPTSTIRFFLLFLSLSLNGCMTNKALDVGSTANDGNPYETIKVFNKHFPHYDDYPSELDMLPVGLMPYCAALGLVYKFDEMIPCAEAYGKIAGMPDAVSVHESIYYQIYANRADEIGDDAAVLKYAKLAEAADGKYTVIRPWELLASLYARQGNYDLAEVYIKKIDKFRIPTLFGSVSLNDPQMSKLRRTVMTRIYVNMGNSAKAREVMSRPLEQISLSQLVLEAVVSTMESYSASLETVNEKIVRKIYEESTSKGKVAKTDKEIDWQYYDRILQMAMSARISLQLGAYKQSKIVYLKLMADPKFKFQKPLYITALTDLSDISYRLQDYKSAAKYAQQGVAMIEQAMPNLSISKERALFVKKHENLYTLLSRALNRTGQLSSFTGFCSRIGKTSTYSPAACKAS